MKKGKGPVYIRYEFSNPSGTPEGGDILQLASHREIEEMVGEIIKVAEIDNVTVNLTIGAEKPFFGFLQKLGMTQEDIDSEIVEFDVITDDAKENAKPSASKKKASKKKPSSKSKTKSKK